MDKQEYFYSSPVGCLHLCGSTKGLSQLEFSTADPSLPEVAVPTVLADCVEQLDAYFYSGLKEFNLPLDLEGTEFQQKVWYQLQQIPFGKIISYGELAVMVGGKNYMRAVGGANNRNPVAIVVPCHRVIGADGKLVGYAGGIWRKEWLLRHEQALLL